MQRKNNILKVGLNRFEIILMGILCLLYLLCSNSTMFGTYADDIKWVLLSEKFLKFSVQSPWLFVPTVETSINWGTSLLFMPVVGLLGRNILAYKVYSTILLCAGSLLFFFATKDFFKPKNRWAYLVLFLFNNFYLSNAGLVISEIGFIFLFGLFVFLFLKYEKLKKISQGQLIFLGILTGMMILTRSLSLIILLIFSFYWFLKKDYRSLILYASVTTAVILPFFIFSKLSSGSLTFYSKYWMLLTQIDLTQFILGVIEKGVFYIKGLSCLTFLYLPTIAPHWPPIKWITSVVIWGIFIYGLFIKRQEPLPILLKAYAVIYLGIIFVWPYVDVRYVRPFFPFFIFITFLGLEELERRKPLKHIISIAIFICVLSNLPEVGIEINKSLKQPTIIPHYSYNWLKENTSISEPIVSPNIAAVTYFTERKGYPFLKSNDLETFVNQAKTQKVQIFFIQSPEYVDISKGVSDPIAAQYNRLMSYISNKIYFEELYRNEEENVGIYRLKGESSQRG